jgi:excinuclease UvrABC nuclease subunit
VISIEVREDRSGLDEALAGLPNRPAVFLLWPREGQPYLARTALLRRRLLRMLARRERPSRMLNLRDTIQRIDYQPTASALESSVAMYELALRHFPSSYVKLINLRLPAYVKIRFENQFPRSQITTHLGRPPSLYYGPFRTRASAERFESQFLDLFQMRRCQEDLAPSPEHPGCIYGEMSMCLRPCQQVVGADEYRHEVARAADFLRTGGRSLLATIGAARDRFSEEMLFEEAARQHKRFEKVQEVLKSRDELACDLDRLHGVAVTRSVSAEAVDLWVVRGGHWQSGRTLHFAPEEGKPVSLDRKLRDIFMEIEPKQQPARRREEYLALLARWYYSSWRDGEWLAFEDFAAPPYRRLVHALSRVARGDSVSPGA